MSVNFFKENLSWKNIGIGALFVILSSVVFIPMFMFVYEGVITYLYAIRLEKVPVIVIQIFMVLIAVFVSISISLLLTDWVIKKTNPFKEEETSVKHHLFFTALLIITFFSASLVYMNIIAIICATLIFWLSKSRTWKIVGFVLICYCLTMQIVFYYRLWR